MLPIPSAGRPAPGNGRPLGIHAKSAVRVYLEKSAAGTVSDPGLARRWRLQRGAAGFLADKGPKIDRYGEQVMAFKYRVAMCHRGTDGGPVTIKRSPDGTRATFLGVQTCGSVWHCPLCAPKVALKRRDELNLAMNRWMVDHGGSVGFVTCTIQHDTKTFGAGKLVPERDEIAEAMSYFKGTRAVRELLKRCGHVGSVRALEPTFGEINGWHLHSHDLAFVAADALIFDRSGRLVLWLSPLGRLVKLWARELIKRGLAGLTGNETPAERRSKLRHLLTHCLTVQGGGKAADYVAKFGKEPEGDRGQWGIASEMTRAHLKNGASVERGVPQRCGHASPWALLNDAVDGDARSEALFREYAEAMQGRRQLFWSRGLKALLKIGEQSDEEIAARPDPKCSEHVIEITPGVWTLILACDARFELLRAAATEGREGVLLLLAELERRTPTHYGGFTQSRAVFMVPHRRAA